MEYYDEGQSTKIMSEFSYFYDMLRIWIQSNRIRKKHFANPDPDPNPTGTNF